MRSVRERFQTDGSQAEAPTAAAASSIKPAVKHERKVVQQTLSFGASAASSAAATSASAAFSIAATSSAAAGAFSASRPAFGDRCYFLGGETEDRSRMREFC